MDNQEAKYIERIEIKGLWGRFDVDWKLNPGVNILVGENGTGKSTILNIIYQAVYPVFNENKRPKSSEISKNLFNIYSKIKATFNNSKYFFLRQTLDTSRESSFGIYSNEETDFADPTSIMNGYNLLINKISTFDSIVNLNDTEKKYKPYLRTDLDNVLDNALNKYVDYQLSKSNDVIFKRLSQENAFEKKLYLIEVLNRLFSKTEKVIDTNENKIAFILKDGTKINWYDLSSGEKQLLIILLTVLCQDGKPSILLLDEPEISLHLRWQYELIEIIRTLNPNCQVIIATHSPSIFNDGWRDKVFWIEDIVKPIQEPVKNT